MVIDGARPAQLLIGNRHLAIGDKKMVELDLGGRRRLLRRSLALLAQGAEVPRPLRVLYQFNARPIKFKRFHLNLATEQGPEAHADFELLRGGERVSGIEMRVFGDDCVFRAKRWREKTQIQAAQRDFPAETFLKLGLNLPVILAAVDDVGHDQSRSQGQNHNRQGDNSKHSLLRHVNPFHLGAPFHLAKSLLQAIVLSTTNGSAALARNLL